MKFTKKFFAMIMALCLCLSTSVTSVFAAEASEVNPSNATEICEGETIVYQDEDVTVVRVDDANSSMNLASTNAMTYGSTWVSSSNSGSFTVSTNNSGTIGITLKAESSSNDSWAYLSVQKPNGSYFKNNVYVDPTTGNGDGAVYKMYFASSGTYTIHYIAYTSVGMRLMCWLY